MSLLLLAFAAGPAHARNVSYVDGWTILGKCDDDSVYSVLHYTPHRLFSAGYRYEYFREDAWHYHAVQLNALAKRWNRPEAQANFYILSDIGGAYSLKKDSGHYATAAFSTGAALDWENRRYFTSYENRLLYAGNLTKTFIQKARIGVAPYVAEYGNLHTWLMAEVRHHTSSRDPWTVTPLVRFFKGPVMAEIGWTVGGSVYVSWRVLF